MASRLYNCHRRALSPVLDKITRKRDGERGQKRELAREIERERE